MITLSNLSFSFQSTSILENLSYSLESNRLYTLIGPSGCGKTTLLNILAGLLIPSSGVIEYRSKIDFGYMFQEDLLLPWRTLKENISLGLEILKKEDDNGCEKYIDAFGLKGYENYYPTELSGGMKQRTAMIRTLLLKPDILLLDEPFSNLDFDIKIRIQKELLKFQKENKTTILIVTHDLEDAIALSDEILILSDKPTTIKKSIKIDFDQFEKNPLEIRKSYKFTDYFSQISSELKYLS
ncbi:MAG: ABC transporter ATP-binding protein [Salinivirgaceae bacterium]|nr:ABC transporter ATP-binding protein [Salinivirgaceae bacterium]